MELCTGHADADTFGGQIPIFVDSLDLLEDDDTGEYCFLKSYVRKEESKNFHTCSDICPLLKEFAMPDQIVVVSPGSEMVTSFEQEEDSYVYEDGVIVDDLDDIELSLT